jgi:hypothetical protein
LSAANSKKNLQILGLQWAANNGKDFTWRE